MNKQNAIELMALLLLGIVGMKENGIVGIKVNAIHVPSKGRRLFSGAQQGFFN